VSLIVGVVEGGLSARPRTSDDRGRCGGHLLLVVESALDEASGESSPGLVSVSTAATSSGVVVLLGGAVGMLPAWSLSSR
jgi:hypothetical protein